MEILDPSMHIATLGEGAKLSMDITLKKGQGYVSADKNKVLELSKAPIGTIAVDSIFYARSQGELHGGKYPCRADHRLR